MRFLNAVVLGVLAGALTGHVSAEDADHPEGQSFELRLKWLGKLSPTAPLSPTDKAECQALQEAWSEYNSLKTQMHNSCIEEQTGAHSAANPAADFADVCTYTACQPYHGRSGGSKDVSDCFDAVRKVEAKERKDAEQRRSEPEPKQQRPSVKSDPSPTSARPKEDARATSSKMPKPSRPATSDASWIDYQQRLAEDDRKWRQEQAERQAKADAKAIELANVASNQANAALNARTADREAESQRIDAQLAAAESRHLTETQGILDRANTAIARLADTSSIPLAPPDDALGSGAAGGSSASDFDFSTLKSSAIRDGGNPVALAVASSSSAYAGLRLRDIEGTGGPSRGVIGLREPAGDLTTSWNEDLRLGFSRAAGWLKPDIAGAYARVNEMWNTFIEASRYVDKKAAGNASSLDDDHAVFTVLGEAKNHAFSSATTGQLASELTGRALDTIEQHGQGLFERVERVFEAASNDDLATALAQSDYSAIQTDLLGQFCAECADSLKRLRSLNDRLNRTTDALSSFFK